jgi:hypothetical protein
MYLLLGESASHSTLLIYLTAHSLLQSSAIEGDPQILRQTRRHELLPTSFLLTGRDCLRFCRGLRFRRRGGRSPKL